MLKLGIHNLELERCPHCSIDHPNLNIVHQFVTHDHMGVRARTWGVYVCRRCGGVVTASANAFKEAVFDVFPSRPEVDATIPSPARDYLKQAQGSLHAPAGAVMLAASAVDAMLKNKGYTKGMLYERIDQAAKDHLITAEMAKWAHEVRLDANEPRHADGTSPLPDEGGAKKAVDFAQALAQFLFVLPARVERGRAEATGTITLQSAQTAKPQVIP